jgi:hypothetical protein
MSEASVEFWDKHNLFLSGEVPEAILKMLVVIIL